MKVKIPYMPKAEQSAPLRRVIEKVAKSMHTNEYHVATMMSYFLEYLSDEVAQGAHVMIPGFGLFVPYHLVKRGRVKQAKMVPIFEAARPFRNIVRMTCPTSACGKEKMKRHKKNHRSSKKPSDLLSIPATAMRGFRDRVEAQAAKFGLDPNSVDGSRTEVQPSRLRPLPKNHAGVLNERKVRQIRALYTEGWTMVKIAKKFKVDESSVKRVIHRKTWGYVH